MISFPAVLISRFRSFEAEFLRLGTAEAASCEGVVTECEVRDALKQVARTRWFTLQSVLGAAAYVCAYSDEYIQPLVFPGSHPSYRYQGRDHIVEERWEAYLGGLRWLQAHNCLKQS